MAKKTMTYEESINRLEEIISFIEQNDISLDESIKLFKEGVSLSKFCMDKLENAEKEVLILTKDYDNVFVKEKFAYKEGFEENE